MYVPFIPEIEGSVVPSVEVTRGAAETGDGRITRLEEVPTPVTGADGMFDVGAPRGITGGAVREYAVDVSTGLTLPG